MLTIDILIIGIIPFNILIQQASYIKNIEIFSITIYNIKKVLTSKSIINIIKKLLIKYHHYFNIFFRVDPNILLLHHFYNHKISLMKKKNSLWDFLYSIFLDKLRVLKKYLEKNLNKEFIRASSFTTTSLLLFAYKLRNSL